MRRILSLFILLMLSGVLAFAQNRVVTGTVTDEKGLPIEGASIKVKGSRVGVAADVNGNFRISAPENATLVVSSSGATEKQVPIAGQSVVAISLTRTGTELANVIVTAQGIRRQPKELGYSTTRLSNSDVNAAHVTNIANGLTGKVSGLQISTVNNGVNPSTRITLRGNRSILGNNQALIVLDNVPVSNNYLNQINPNDIDNVTVLKGASASALYGTDASNGVLIITTKTGTKGKPIIKYSNTTQVEAISYLPDFQNRFGQFGGEYDPTTLGIVYFPENPFIPYVPYENQSYGPEFNGKPVFVGIPVRIFNADGTFRDTLKTGIYSAQPKAKRNFFDKGITSQNDFSVSGGDDKSKFYFSVQDVDTKGTVPGDRKHRDALRLNGSREIGKFTINYDVGYTISKIDYTPDAFTLPRNGSTTYGGGSYQNRNVYFTVIQTPANIDLRDFRNWKTDPFANPNGYFNAYYSNPWWTIDQVREIDRTNDLLANVSLTYKPTSWLSILGRAAVAREDFNMKYTKVGFTFDDYIRTDPYGSHDARKTQPVSEPQAVDGFSYTNRLTGDFIVSADKSFGNFKTRLVLGSQVVERSSRVIDLGSVALVQPNDFNNSNRVGEAGVYENLLQRRTIGAYADMTIGYNDYLFLHGSARNDWTSLLSQANRSFFYPAVDLSFVFTEAIGSLKNNKILSFGKLRGAYSRTGQVSIGEYALQNTFAVTGGFPYGGVAGFSLGNNFANPNIKPEFTTEKEVGLELGFFENRINLSTAYFHTRTDNQTLQASISAATGGTSSTINTGVMINDGIEADLKFTPILKTKHGLRWDISVNFSYIKNYIASIAPGIDTLPVQAGTSAYAITGQPYPVIRVLDWGRDSLGRIIISPTTGYPDQQNHPQKFQNFGTGNPPYKLGISTSLSFKGLTLSATADYRAGAVIYNAIGADLDFTGVSAYSTQSNRQRFVLPNSSYPIGGGKYAANTSISTQNGNEDFWASTWNGGPSNYINSSDFWKIREVSLSYEVPRSVLSGIKFIKGLNIGVTGRNLFMWRAKENVWTDPEFSNTTGNGVGTTNINQTPPTRILGGNLTISF